MLSVKAQASLPTRSSTRRRELEILSPISRTGLLLDPKGDKHETKVILDSGASVSLIDQKLAKKLNLKPIPSDLPTLAWVGKERKFSYGAYDIQLDLKDDHDSLRTMSFIAYGVDTEGMQLIISNHTLARHGVKLDLGEQTWTYGVTKSNIELVPLEEFKHMEGQIAFLGMVRPELESHRLTVDGEDVETPPADEPTVPETIRDLTSCFSKESGTALPPRTRSDHKIDIVDGKEPPYGPLYNLSAKELEILREYIKDNLKSGRIRHSASPAGAPIMFIPKKDGSLRLCVDYRGLNSVTIKNRCPLPLINETLDRLCGAKYFTSLDLREGYHRIRIAEGHEWKTAFRSRYGHYEYMVMPFGLANAPATFQAHINRVLSDYLDNLCVVYLDDILIYTHDDDIEKHWATVRKILVRLRENNLFCNLKKCFFAKPSLDYLGFVVSREGVKADPKKLDTIRSWPVPKTVKETQSFLGFSNFYRRFIEGYSRIVRPLHAVTKGDPREFNWTSEAQSAFEKLKECFVNPPILRFYEPKYKIRIETDASDYAVGAIMSQLCDDGKWHPIAYVSRGMTPSERNWETYDKELLGIVYAFQQWRHYLEGAQHTIQVLTDHNNLAGVRAVQKLSPRQARWAIFLAAFDFEVEHRAGKTNPADGPSRRPDYWTENTLQTTLLPTLKRKLAVTSRAHEDAGRASRVLSTLATDPRSGPTTSPAIGEACDDSVAGAIARSQCVPRYSVRVLLTETAQGSSEGWEELLLQAQGRDDFASSKIAEQNAPSDRASHSRKVEDWSVDDRGLLRRRGRIYVPPEASVRQELLKMHHDHPLAGHFGAERTSELLSRSYWWREVKQDVAEYVKTCAICQRTKAPRRKPFGELSSLPVPDGPWQELTMDFITGLPPSKMDNVVYDAILVVMDRFTKKARYFPARKDWDTADLARCMIKGIFHTYGTPKGIVSDRGPTFTSDFWAELCYQLQIKRRLSTAFHPQTDGQTERQNQTLEHYLRCFVDESHENWAELLSAAEFAYNNSVHASTGYTPFYQNFGFHARMPEAPEAARPEGEVAHAVDRTDQLRADRAKLIETMKRVQEYQKRYYDGKHTPMRFNKGDLVLLSTKNIKLKLPSKKTSDKYAGPYRIAEVIGKQAYRLHLPNHWRIHDVFHVSLLKPYHLREGTEEINTTAPDILSDGEEVYEVEKIIGEHNWRDTGKRQYKVRWKGFDEEHDTWIYAEEFENMDELIAEWEEKQKEKRTKATAKAVRTRKRRRAY